MTNPRRVRWDCPNDLHPGVLSSTRPPKDSLVRYCLPCSEKAGRLVLRVAPALERKRAAAAVTSAAKAKAKRTREAKVRAARKQADHDQYFVEGVDLRAEMKRFARLRSFGGRNGRLVKRPPTLVISRRHQYPGRHGYAEPWANRITIAVYPRQHLADARETLLHELTHIVVGSKRTGTGKNSWHGSEFRIVLNRARREANERMAGAASRVGQS